MSSPGAQAAAEAGAYGLTFALAAGLGGGAGYLLDRWFGWRPIVFTLILGVLGVVAGFVLVVRATARTRRDPDDASSR